MVKLFYNSVEMYTKLIVIYSGYIELYVVIYIYIGIYTWFITSRSLCSMLYAYLYILNM